MYVVGGDCYRGNDGALPGILGADLRNSDVMPRPEPVFQTPDDVPLLFKRMSLFNVDFERENADRGHRILDA